MRSLWVRRLFIAAPFVLVVLGALAYFVLWPFAAEMVTQVRLLPAIERRIGAEIRAPYVMAGRHEREVITFAAVVADGPCGRAGITSGDIVVSDKLIGSLCKRLQGAAGTKVVVDVVPGGPGPAIAERPKRQAVILLP